MVRMYVHVLVLQLSFYILKVTWFVYIIILLKNQIHTYQIDDLEARHILPFLLPSSAVVDAGRMPIIKQGTKPLD